MTTAIDTPETDSTEPTVLAMPAVTASSSETASVEGGDRPVAPETTLIERTAPPETQEHASIEPSAAKPAGVSPAPAASATPVDCGPLLKRTFPALFTGTPKPLKLRIQTDIQERAPGVFSKQALSSFFRRYTGSTSYLLAVSRAKTRFDLDGAPAGELSEEHRQIALDELTRRRSNQESRQALEEQQRRNRATLLHDFERTTLTPANFCALKGIGVDELDGYLATARREAAERPQNPPAFEPSRRPPPDRQPRPPREGRAGRADPAARASPRRR